MKNESFLTVSMPRLPPSYPLARFVQDNTTQCITKRHTNKKQKVGTRNCLVAFA